MLGLAQPVVYGIGLVAGGGLTAFNASWYALLADVSDERRRGRVFGLVSAVSNGGIVVGAKVAAQLWEAIDLRVAMGSASVAFLLAGVGLLAFRYPEHRQPVHV